MYAVTHLDAPPGVDEALDLAARACEERDRYREALERIAGTHTRWADTVRQIARNALADRPLGRWPV